MTTLSTSLSDVGPGAARRITSLDQYRGYTVAGMLLVNFLGTFAICPKVWRHSHDYLSYADTIMPQFLFAVGFAFRLTFGRRAQLQGAASAYGRVVKRMLGLVLVALVVYQVNPPRAATWQQLGELGVWGAIGDPLKRTWFQTLMHIAATGLWLVPVIRSPAAVRMAWMVGSAGLHVLLSHEFYFLWVNTPPHGVDGGPLGFLTWVIPAGVGTLACDAIQSLDQRGRGRTLVQIFVWSVLLMGLGYAFSCGTRFYDVPPERLASLADPKLAAHPVWPAAEQRARQHARPELRAWLAEPPFVPPPSATERKWNYWMMSQRAGTLSYLTFGAGFSLAVYGLFYLACDVGGWQLSFFRTFGTNALAAYVLHFWVSRALKPFIPPDAPAWYVGSGLLTFFATTWLLVRTLEKQGVYLKV